MNKEELTKCSKEYLIKQLEYTYKEIERLKEQLSDEIDEELKQSEIMVKKQQEIDRLNNIISKAIEYIEHNIVDYITNYDDLREDLLDILKGVDKK